MKGRKPKPTSLKIVTGNPGRRKLNNKEPKPKKINNGIPEPPEHLSEYAKKEWYYVVGSLHQCGILTDIDRGGLAMYCQSYARWKKAEEAIQLMAEKNPSGGGLVIKTTNGNMIQNPLVGTANTAMRDAMRFAAEYGLTPSSRARLEIDEESENQDEEGEKYFM
jgi:P27 family predicted phage terminase small subunit